MKSLTVVKDVNTMSKLTVTRDGDVRIKLAKGLSEEEQGCLLSILSKIAEREIERRPCHTTRGVVGDISIRMQNNAATYGVKYLLEDYA